MMYMLDTNICIYIIKHKPESVINKFLAHESNDMCISSITYAELMHGVEKSKFPQKNRAALVLFLSSLHIIEFDASAAEEYGKIRADLEKRGTPIGVMDMLIAGHARSRKLTVITNNMKEFDRVDGLKVENWV